MPPSQPPSNAGRGQDHPAQPGNTGRGGRFRSPGQRVPLTGAQVVSLRPMPQGATGADVGLVGRRCLDGCQKAALFCAVYHQRISATKLGSAAFLSDAQAAFQRAQA